MESEEAIKLFKDFFSGGRLSDSEVKSLIQWVKSCTSLNDLRAVCMEWGLLEKSFLQRSYEDSAMYVLWKLKANVGYDNEVIMWEASVDRLDSPVTWYPALFSMANPTPTMAIFKLAVIIAALGFSEDDF